MPEEVTGSVTVPADHDNPERGELRLFWTRLRSPHPEQTPVIFLAGGPGDSGTGWMNHPPFRAVFERAAESRDVVLLDQRGCGRSEQDTSCVPPDFRPGWLLDESTAFDMLAEQARRTLDSMPEMNPRFYTPWQSARDVACVADALGVDRVHLWGYSYGTHLAQAALKAVPDRINRVVLCGCEGPNQTYKLPSRIQAQMMKLAGLARQQGVCDDLAGLMSEVHESLDRHSVTVDIDGEKMEVGRFGLQWISSTWIGVSNRFVNLPALYRSIRDGEKVPLERAVRGFAKMLTQRRAVFYLKDSASGATRERLARIEAEAPACVLGNAANFPFWRIREPWGQIDLADAFREPLNTDRSVFILTGSLDGFTPTANALESLSAMPNAIHAEIVNAAHNDLLACPEANRDAISFLRGEPILPGPYSVPAPELA